MPIFCVVYQDSDDLNDIYTIYTQYRNNVVHHWNLNKYNGFLRDVNNPLRNITNRILGFFFQTQRHSLKIWVQVDDIFCTINLFCFLSTYIYETIYIYIELGRAG